MYKIHVICKIGEALSHYDSDASGRLHTGEPETFGRIIAEASENLEDKTLIVFFDPNDSSSSNIALDERTDCYTATISSIEDLQHLINLGEPKSYGSNRQTHISLNAYLWQGISMKKDAQAEWIFDKDANAPHYKFWNMLQSQMHIDNQYFVQTDLRLPLFDLASLYEDDSLFIDTAKMTILSQANIDYQNDVYDIAKEQMSDNLSKSSKDKFYTEFAGFKHTHLHLIQYPNMRGDLPEVKKEIDSIFLTQGWGLMSEIRQDLFLELLCDYDVNKHYTIGVLGTHYRSWNTDIVDEFVNNPYKKFLLPSFLPKVNWLELRNTLSKSVTSLCINNNAYEKYGLIPNRIVESVFSDSIPILSNCDSAKRLFVDNEVFNIDSLAVHCSEDYKRLLDSFIDPKGVPRQNQMPAKDKNKILISEMKHCVTKRYDEWLQQLKNEII